jgi:hypothetical protein
MMTVTALNSSESAEVFRPGGKRCREMADSGQTSGKHGVNMAKHGMFSGFNKHAF